MKVLICPLNWGLGHATRCVPLIKQYIAEGHVVTVATDGNALKFLSEYFPEIEIVVSKSFTLRYSAGKSQFWILLLQFHRILYGILREHFWLKNYLKLNPQDVVISDNRFGLWNEKTKCVYITHQIMVKMPKSLTFFEPVIWRLHRAIINQFSACWIPDIEANNGLSGDLAHKYPLPKNAAFIGILSRFTNLTDFEQRTVDVLAIVSGLEPQRTIFEKFILEKYKESNKKVIILRGLPAVEDIVNLNPTIQLVSHASDFDFLSYCKSADKIICRSGYSTIMDLVAMDCLHKAEFFPTPGQTEQEYLCEYLTSKNKVDKLTTI